MRLIIKIISSGGSPGLVKCGGEGGCVVYCVYSVDNQETDVLMEVAQCRPLLETTGS